MEPREPDRWCPQGRWLHLVDADNLAGTPLPTRAEVRGVHDAYRAALRPGPVDHTIVACSHKAGVAVGLEWSGTQLLWRSGPDGADLVLLDALGRPDDVAARFAGVVVGSGDGIFVDAVREIRAAGIPAVVAWGRGALACSLARVATAAVPIFDVTRPRRPLDVGFRPRNGSARDRPPLVVRRHVVGAAGSCGFSPTHAET